ncbi:MAG: class I SAM-dependent methyltransferase [SAR202 cluster bacterium]|nr:class I SAM-dependent methyltransferase [SAR202 cluster bacterium]
MPTRASKVGRIMTDKWRKTWLDDLECERYGSLLYSRAIGELPEMESSKAVAARLRSVAKPGDQILDAGCGAGHYLRSLSNNLPFEFQYTGVDATPRFIELARQAFASFSDADFEIGDINALPFADASYDLVMSNNVLLHLPSIQKPLQELCRVARRYVLVRTLVGERSFRIQDVHGSGDEFDETGEPIEFHYYNIYSKPYIEYLLANIPFVKSWQIVPDQAFDETRIAEAATEQSDAPDVTTMLGGWQLNGYILQPWSFIEVEIAR